jgi:probable rRNA maturation factor
LVDLQKRVVGLAPVSLERFVARARQAAGLRGRVNVLVTGGGQIRSLNRRFRGKDKPTDVLSFPTRAANPGGQRAFAGDIAICADIAIQNAARFGHSAKDEIKILILHGILHLAGFDHERDNGAMARKELKLRELLRLPSTLIERVQSGKSDSRTKKKHRRDGAGAARV